MDQATQFREFGYEITSGRLAKGSDFDSSSLFEWSKNKLCDSVLKQVAAGAEGAMDKCLDTYGGLVWSIARRLCGNAEETEDAVQDAFVDLWKTAHRFDESKSSESTFIAIITRRRVIDRLRKTQRQPETQAFEDGCANDPKVGATLEIHEEATKARRLMGELRDEERRVLELAVDQGLSQAEIARRTGMPLGTVKTHARRGMIRLRELLLDGAVQGEAI